ncbi:MAG: hypothetical protein AAF722_15870, partial [Cyanobacteria bacterium P01_C01_bin.70]
IASSLSRNGPEGGLSFDSGGGRLTMILKLWHLKRNFRVLFWLIYAWRYCQNEPKIPDLSSLASICGKEYPQK